MDNENELFAPYKKLVEITVGDRRFAVPENNSLLRCFQYISLAGISRGDFCWNGTCSNCQVWLAVETDEEKPVLACRTMVAAGMIVVRTSGEIRLGNRK